MKRRILFGRSLGGVSPPRPPPPMPMKTGIPVIEQWCLLQTPVISSLYHCAKENVEDDEQETVIGRVERVGVGTTSSATTE